MEEMKKNRFEISHSTLKIIACVIMLLDHVGACVLARFILSHQIYSGGQLIPLEGDALMSLFKVYQVFRYTGRIAFPIFCYGIVEGFLRTKNVKKYALRIFIFAIISEVPFDLAFTGSTFYNGYQNVGFTLLIGLFVIWAISIIEEKFPELKDENGWPVSRKNSAIRVILSFAVLFAGAALAFFMHTDYKHYGVLTIAVIYVLRNNKVFAMLAATFILVYFTGGDSGMEITAMLATPLLLMYRGKMGKDMKYFFYGFYPVHLFLIWLSCYVMGMGWISAIGK